MAKRAQKRSPRDAEKKSRGTRPETDRASDSIEFRSTGEVASDVARELNCDVIFYNGVIERPCDEALIRECMKRRGRRRANALLVLVTNGGNPDAAYRIARCLQRSYERFSLYVPGICKSAGTLIAVGAHELVISDHGELGPLDIQMAKKDEFFDSQSGLTVTTALQSLEERAYAAVERMFFEIEANTGGILSVQTATKLAADLVIGLYAPIAQQIDPMHLGEASRALLIADRYGSRLNRYSGNLRSAAALRSLLSTYPSHSFVIDRDEAETYFANVRQPSHLELELAESLGTYGRRVRMPRQLPLNPADIVCYLTEPPEPADGDSVTNDDGETDAAANDRTGNPSSGVDPRTVARSASAQGTVVAQADGAGGRR